MEPTQKIYVVVAVLALIQAGIFLYLFLLDRKLTRMEKEMDERGNNRSAT